MKKILFVCGSINQTTMVHDVYQFLANEHDCYFTPFYDTGILRLAKKLGLVEWTILGENARQKALAYLRSNRLPIDEDGKQGGFDLAVLTSDLLVQKNLRHARKILIQEGMTDPPNPLHHAVRYLHLPRWMAGTAVMGQSDAFDIFCVASEGYKDFFIRQGVKPEKIRVTGIPNFDNVEQFRNNDFPHHDYVLVATSDMRETFKRDNRKRFIRWTKEIANGRQLIFKLHPLEKVGRATREITKIAPDAIVYSTGNTDHMVANCSALITQYSSVTFIGLALGKDVYSYFDVEELRKLVPVQNKGASARNIARICRETLVTNRETRLAWPQEPILRTIGSGRKNRIREHSGQTILR